jgi:hypothetical protein
MDPAHSSNSSGGGGNSSSNSGAASAGASAVQQVRVWLSALLGLRPTMAQLECVCFCVRARRVAGQWFVHYTASLPTAPPFCHFLYTVFDCSIPVSMIHKRTSSVVATFLLIAVACPGTTRAQGRLPATLPRRHGRSSWHSHNRSSGGSSSGRPRKLASGSWAAVQPLRGLPWQQQHHQQQQYQQQQQQQQ